MPDFVHLHNHSDYSLLDGAASIPGLVARAKELGMKHLALTDHGNMFGALRFYKTCREEGLNPIIGCELYVAPGSRFVKRGTENGNRYFHLVLLAKNQEGYRNLIQLTSRGYLEGFYYKPRVDMELLKLYSGGIIALSACLGGEIPYLILQGAKDEAKKRALEFQEIYGERNYYLELHRHGIQEQKIVNENLVRISRETGIPLVATNDIHYTYKEDANAQDILICIGTNRKRDEKRRMRFGGPEFYLKTQEEMEKLFSDVPEALVNTLKIAEKCDLTIDLPGPLLPDYEIPPQFSSPDEYLRHLTHEGLKERYPDITEKILARENYELETIISMGFTGYFLIVWDFIHWALEHDIPVGPGRGSGAGSIVAFSLKITDIDPLKYNLLFERFLNPERVSMPDFDIDFCFERRQEVIDYVTRKYGKKRVGQIITFGTLKAKAVIKDVARVLDIPFAEANQISKLVPDGPKVTLKDAFEAEPKLKELENRGGIYSELIDTGKRLEGLNRHCSTHAAGVVIGKENLTHYVPLYRDSKTGSVTTQYTMDQLENCGLVKMDFLGLKTLTLIQNTENLIRVKEKDFAVASIPEDNEATFFLLGQGKSAGIFQFESSGMQSILKQAKPNSIEDLIALNALYRPGPMQNIPQFIECKMGRRPISYPDPSLEEILKPTYGVIVYQEQVMQVAQIIGGFSLGKADILRRAMGKKKEKEMERMKVEFIRGAKERGYREKLADSIFEMLKPFAGYGFNKSHAAAYSVLAYKTAYLKANYPAEFMAATLTNEINNTDKLSQYITETREMGIEILPPSIALSEKYFSVADGKIVYGLIGIKNVGSSAVEEILRARIEGGEFSSFINFLERVDLKVVNRKVSETLIATGIFDGMGHNRATLIYNLGRVLEFVSRRKEEERSGQASLFGTEEASPFNTIELEPVEEWPQKELLQQEKELLGFYFSGHPLDKYRGIWEKSTNLDLTRRDRAQKEKSYTILGLLKGLRSIPTKNGLKMAFAVLEDFKGSIELVFFPDIWEQIGESIKEDEVIGLTGKIDLSRGDPKFLVDSILKPEELEESRQQEIHIRIAHTLEHEDALYDFRSFLIGYQGACPVYLHLQGAANRKETVIRVSSHMGISSKREVLENIQQHPQVLEVWKE